MDVCDVCSLGCEEHNLVTIVSKGSKIDYTIPSFPALTVALREIKYQFVDVDDNIIYDGYIRECPELMRPYPSLVVLCTGHTNAFTVSSDEFSVSVSTEKKVLCKGLVFVIWKWKWEGEGLSLSGDDAYIGESTDEEDIEPAAGDDIDADIFESSLVTHSVVFKCMGTNKSSRSQEILAEAAGKIKSGNNVEVKLEKEPSNPKDSRAIAFHCKLGNDWVSIGYVVSEALECVHHAMDNNMIISVKFEWIRFITHWSRSGVGWYCGIKLTRQGEWPKEIVRCSSTI